MRIMVRSLIGLAIVVAAAACGADTGTDITDRTWQVTELGGEAPLEGTTLDMAIVDDGVSGSSGCNSYTGGATVDEDTITLGPNFAMTFMACEEPIMAQEQSYVAALTSATSFQVEGETLTLLDDAGAVLVVFE